MSNKSEKVTKHAFKYERSHNDSKMEHEQLNAEPSPQIHWKQHKNDSEIVVDNLKTIIVALNQKIKTKEDVEK